MINKITDIELKNLAFNNIELFIERVDYIVSNLLSTINEIEALKKLLTMLDITTLRDDDYRESLVKIISQSTYIVDNNKGIVAGVCIYSNLLPVLNTLELDKRIRRVVVSGGFPTGQLSLEGKLNDIAFAIENGADEIDVPINRGLFFENKKEMAIEISAMKSIISQNKEVKLKVILETSELKSYENVYNASMIAMENGADFIKTSTGKTGKGADVYSAAIMMLAIKDYMVANGRIVGFKAAGGIRKSSEALKYYVLMQYFFGDSYINKDNFRIGCSNLKNDIIDSIKNKIN
ncbi:MAG: deoxyribose-phosphate aldolase [Bacteroidales bacterium]|nr:deoxyribose-phosphate aldolase [Bacteroidales bacterium]